ncbi:MAG: GNAT family N-acetyltransferase [Betaproteobacteria bacterium]
MVDVRLLADFPNVIPTLAGWYRAEWSTWFGDTPVEEIAADLANVANRDALPLGLVAFVPAGQVAGVCSLRADPFEPYPHAGPWLRGLYVDLPWRGKRIAGELLAAAELHAARLGVPKLYAATGTAVNMFERAGWLGFDEVRHEQQTLVIFAKRIR